MVVVVLVLQYQMVIDPEGTPEQKKARGTHWIGKTFEQVLAHLEASSGTESKVLWGVVVQGREPCGLSCSRYSSLYRGSKQSRLLLWVYASPPQVVEEEMEELSRCGISEQTTYEEFAKHYLSSRPMGYGSHSLLGRGLYALQVRLIDWVLSLREDAPVSSRGSVAGGLLLG